MRCRVSITVSAPRMLTLGGRERQLTSPVTRLAVLLLPSQSAARLASHQVCTPDCSASMRVLSASSTGAKLLVMLAMASFISARERSKSRCTSPRFLM